MDDKNHDFLDIGIPEAEGCRLYAVGCIIGQLAVMSGTCYVALSSLSSKAP